MQLRRFHWVGIFGLFLMIVLFALSVFVSSESALLFYRKAATQNSIIHGVQNINSASDTIVREVTLIARKSATDTYDAILEQCDKGTLGILSENELEGYFRLGYFNRVRQVIGERPEVVYDTIDSYIKKDGIFSVHAVRDNKTELECVKSLTGEILSIRINNLTLEYTDPIIGSRHETYNYVLSIPDVFFYTGNDDMFDHCMIAGKGIYITGATSSVIGNIYAGEHDKSQRRDKEVEFGEVSEFGGINILSTQLGIESDRIVSCADININGSFVIMRPENSELISYASHLNSYDGYAKESMYMLDGTFCSTNEMSEEELERFYSYCENARLQSIRLEKIPMYYDSDNDEQYDGPYRKIMSNGDIEIKEDITGIIMTPYNVIIGDGVNVEGLIICGDRIYIRGNNNIVANREVLRDVIGYEDRNIGQIEAIDYLGLINRRKIIEPSYYVVPYR